MLKSFITAFIQCNVGLEDKLTRAPLLGLAKSIYIIHCSKNEAENIRISCVYRREHGWVVVYSLQVFRGICLFWFKKILVLGPTLFICWRNRECCRRLCFTMGFIYCTADVSKTFERQSRMLNNTIYGCAAVAYEIQIKIFGGRFV